MRSGRLDMIHTTVTYATVRLRFAPRYRHVAARPIFTFAILLTARCAAFPLAFGRAADVPRVLRKGWHLTQFATSPFGLQHAVDFAAFVRFGSRTLRHLPFVGLRTTACTYPHGTLILVAPLRDICCYTPRCLVCTKTQPTATRLRTYTFTGLPAFVHAAFCL